MMKLDSLKIFCVICIIVVRLSDEVKPEMDITARVFKIRSASQCYGKRLTVLCDPDHVIRVVTSKYRQTLDCDVDMTFEPNRNCSMMEPHGAACNGRRGCGFMAPWVHISSSCGYSNNFIVVYQCIPEHYMIPVCSKANVVERRGFLTSPNYPQRYPKMTSCSTTITAPPGARLRFQLLDVHLSSDKKPHSKETTCHDRLWISIDGANRSKYLCSSEQIRGAGLQNLSTNQSMVHFISGLRVADSVRGFWLYFESIFDRNSTIPAENQSSILPLKTTTTGSDNSRQRAFKSSPETDHHFEESEPVDRLPNNQNYFEPLSTQHSTYEEETQNNYPARTSEEVEPDDQMVEETAVVYGDGVFPQKLIHLHSSDMHPDLIVERIPWRGQLRVESRTVRLTTITSSGTPMVTTRIWQHKSDNPITFGLFELSMMSGAITLGVIVLVSVSIGCYFYLKRRRKTIYGEKINTKRAYKNVIFAFGSNNTTPCSTPELDFSRQSVDCANTSSPYWWSCKANNSREGLLPIDETMEDLYAEVKRCGSKTDPEALQRKIDLTKSTPRPRSVGQIKQNKQENKAVVTSTSGRTQIQSINIELLGCGAQKSWNCQPLGSLTFARELPCDVYGKLHEEIRSQPLNPRSKQWMNGRGDRSGSMMIPMIYTHDPHSFLNRCSSLSRTAPNQAVDRREATLLEDDNARM